MVAGEGVVVDQDKVHGNKICQDEVAISITIIYDIYSDHLLYNYSFEAGGFAAMPIKMIN